MLQSLNSLLMPEDDLVFIHRQELVQSLQTNHALSRRGTLDLSLDPRDEHLLVSLRDRDVPIQFESL